MNTLRWSLIFLLGLLGHLPILNAQTFSGDKTLITQMEVDDFGANYTEITGNLFIVGGVTSLSPLSNLNAVGGAFSISANSGLTSISFPVLNSVGDYFSITDNPVLTSISFPLLSSVGSSLSINDNFALISVSFPVFNSVGSFFGINFNPVLTSISFPVLNSFGSINISDNNALADCCTFFPILDSGGVISVSRNLAGCNSQQEILDGGPCPLIPTMSQWALFILGLCLTSMAVVTIRKRVLAVS